MSIGLPEAAVAIGPQLAVGGQALERLALEGHVVALDAVQHGRLEHEEPAVDPGAVAHGLLLEGPHGRSADCPSTSSSSICSAPKRPSGCTAVIVASLPCARWNSSSFAMSTSATPSP